MNMSIYLRIRKWEMTKNINIFRRVLKRFHNEIKQEEYHTKDQVYSTCVTLELGMYPFSPSYLNYCILVLMASTWGVPKCTLIILARV